MPQQVMHWIELTAAVILAVYLFRPRRKPPSHPLPSGDARLLLRRLLAHKKWRVSGNVGAVALRLSGIDFAGKTGYPVHLLGRERLSK